MTNVNIVWGEPEQIIMDDVMHVIMLYCVHHIVFAECFSTMFASASCLKICESIHHVKSTYFSDAQLSSIAP